MNKDFAHLQPGDTRFLALDTLGLSAAAQDILRTAAKARNCALRLDSTDLCQRHSRPRQRLADPPRLAAARYPR